jgi:hypothetical protein
MTLDRYDATFLTVWLGVVVFVWPAWIWASIDSRRKRGEPLVPRAPAGAAFCERAASGRARGNVLGNAHNCLMVAVTGDEVWITPTFPFNMIAAYGVMGLEYRVPRAQVVSARRRATLFGAVVATEIARAGKRPRTLGLRHKNPDAFLAALKL